MAWTKEQEEAITKRGESIIVSAGAGSGKTAVLSERILTFCKNGGDIRRVLVLTFTEAAASEMKERIRKKLKENHLDREAEYIDSAYITTFDSYSLSIVKKYYYVLGLKKGISIMDSALIETKMDEIIRNLFTEYYLSEDPRFYSFLKKYSLQDDKDILKMVKDMTNSLELIVDADRFIAEYEDTYFSSNKKNEILSSYSAYVIEEVEEFISSMEELKSEALYDPRCEGFLSNIDIFLSHLSSFDSYSNLYQEITLYELPRLPRNVDERVKELKEIASDKLKSLKQNVFKGYPTLDSMWDEILSTKNDVLFLLEMCKRTMDRLFEYKIHMNMFGFMDIAKLAIKLVKENPDIKDELKNSYDEILVDEYQDTSDIQETFLSYIESNNRYMVGDIKQAIYRFRNANPYIFKEKYNRFSNKDGGYKIDLSFNFRSRMEVLDNINLLFNQLMTDTLGDADYKKDHQMHYGQKEYLNLEQNIDYNLEILKYKEEEDIKYTQAEIEAFIIAKDIKKRLLESPKALHKDGFSTASYNDFAILISTAGEFLTFKSIFEYLNIPLSIEASLDLKASILPTLYKNILVVMAALKNQDYSKEYYHALASLSRSFIYEYSDEDIYKLIYLHEGYPILEDFYKLIDTDELSYSTLFFKIDSILHIYNKLSKIGDVDSSLVVLEYIHNIFMQFDTLEFNIDEAKDYMDHLLSSGIKMEYKPTSSQKDAVRIMTIHKSKGLEFPYVYFPLLTKEFNQADMKKSIGLSKEYGIFIPFIDEGKGSTIIKSLYSKEVRDEDISEKVRLFYVALTRAREKMIFITPDKKKKEILAKNIKSFKDMMDYANNLSCFEHPIDLEDYAIENYKLSLKKEAKFDGVMKLDYDSIETLEKIENVRISKEVKRLLSIDEKKSIEFGLKFHSILEALDFNHLNLNDIDMDSYTLNTLTNLFKNPIFSNVKNSKSYHELEFYYTKDLESYHGIIDLLNEYDDHIDLIDYKLSNLDSAEYKRQLLIYKEYVEGMSNKRVDTYLVSILKNEIKKIEFQ